VGLLSIFRATLQKPDLYLITGKVTGKRIVSFSSYRSGTHYGIALLLAGHTDMIAINAGSENEEERKHVFNLIDTGKAYQFYMDPTIPTTNRINWGIDEIDYNNREVYITSNKLNLYGGTFISILSLAGIVGITKYKKKQQES
jgi:hypothetical protein